MATNIRHALYAVNNPPSRKQHGNDEKPKRASHTPRLDAQSLKNILGLIKNHPCLSPRFQ
jgi:hypothetical protein